MKTFQLFLLACCCFAFGMNHHASAQQVAGGSAVRTMTLEECLKIAAGDNPEVQIGVAQVQDAEGRVKSAFAPFLPTLSINGGYSRTLNDTTLNVFPRASKEDSNKVELAFQPFYTPEVFRNGFNANISANYTIFNGFQRENTYSQTQSNFQSSQSSLSHTKRRIWWTVRSQYIAVMRSKQVLKVRQEDFQVGKKQLERIKAQYEAGVIAVATVYTQEADVANRELAIVQAENDLELAKGALLTTLGMNPGEPADFVDIAQQTTTESDIRAFRAEIGDFNKAYGTAYGKRLDLAAAKASIEAANAGVNVAQAAYFPTVNATAGYNWNSPLVGNFQYGSQSLGINFRYNIFDGLDRDARTQIARASVIQSEVQKRQSEQRVASDVQNAFIQLNTSEKNLDITARGLKAAQQNFDAAEERFKVGAANILDLTTANGNLATAKINRINALYNYIAAQYQMKFALGILDEGEVK
ncbi:MAG: TolC family protein [Candidatus Kapabacteria bacterium]|nr:TolC family protein [Candidatus Kapabacteria bacterium]